jgi:hypothetical protein
MTKYNDKLRVSEEEGKVLGADPFPITGGLLETLHLASKNDTPLSHYLRRLRGPFEDFPALSGSYPTNLL